MQIMRDKHNFHAGLVPFQLHSIPRTKSGWMFKNYNEPGVSGNISEPRMFRPVLAEQERHKQDVGNDEPSIINGKDPKIS
jgi:hypothetical protein